MTESEPDGTVDQQERVAGLVRSSEARRLTAIRAGAPRRLAPLDLPDPARRGATSHRALAGSRAVEGTGR